jgi:D-lactate dehydrogenase
MVKKLKVAFFDSKPYDIKSFENENRNYGYKIKFFTAKLNIDSVKLAGGYDAVCVFVNDDINKGVIHELENMGIRLIALRCAGYNNVNLEAAFGNVHIARVPDYSPHAVAEHATCLMLALNRKIHKAYYRIRDNNFSINGLMGFDMFGKTAGVIGTGKIGRAVINILKGFGMKVKAYDAFPNEKAAKDSGFEYTSLDSLYAESDIITLHCPLNDKTFHLINRHSISKMKKGVMLINTGRGQLIDSSALLDGLKKKKIASAGLDVYEEESEYFFEDKSDEIILDDVLARLTSFNNVIITSHQGFFTKEAISAIASTTFGNIKEFFTENTLSNEICYRCGKTPCPRKTGKAKKCF